MRISNDKIVVWRGLAAVAATVVFTLLPALINSLDRQKDWHHAANVIFAAIACAAAFFAVASAVWAFWANVLTCWEVRLSPEAIEIVRHGLILQRAWQTPADQLMEVNILTSSAHTLWQNSDPEEDIALRTPTEAIRFGAGLPLPEKEWIVSVIERVVVGTYGFTEAK